ncbi:MAG TPA: hypothetical protein VEA37_03850 [Flavobacterium sp.]|nr:hypothetical protein [Flavobacterium sp.]
MKRVYKFTFALASLLALASCEDPEPTIYNGDVNELETFVDFTNSVYSLPVVRDEDGSVEITLQASTVSSVDRTYTLTIDEGASTADPGIYTFPASITIPAGQHAASAVVEAVDEGVTASNQTIVFSISNLADFESTDGDSVTINIFEVCPLQDEFLGDYVFNQTSGILTSGGNDVTIFEQGGIVTLEAGSNEYERVINSEWFPGVWDQPMTFVINFNCGQTFVPNGDLNGLYCGEDSSIIFEFGQGAVPGTYNTNNDAVITVNVLQDLNSSCLESPVQASFTLTKAD